MKTWYQAPRQAPCSGGKPASPSARSLACALSLSLKIFKK